MLSSYRQLQNTPALLPETAIYLLTLSVLSELLEGSAFVTVHLPASHAFEIPPLIDNKTSHITQRIPQKNPDFVRKICTFSDSVLEPLKSLLDKRRILECISILERATDISVDFPVAIIPKKFRYLRISKNRC